MLAKPTIKAGLLKTPQGAGTMARTHRAAAWRLPRRIRITLLSNQ
jgi:hypothetical protein